MGDKGGAVFGDRLVREQVLNSLGASILVLREQHGGIRVEMLNTALRRRLSQAGHTSANQDPAELLHLVCAEDRDPLACWVRSLFSGAAQNTFTFRCGSAEDEPMVWLAQGTVSRLTDDSQLVCLCFSDFSVARTFKHRLQESEDSLRAALGHLNVNDWEYDILHGCAICGQRLQQVFGMPRIVPNFPEAWLSGGHIHPDDRAVYRVNTAQVKAGRSLAWDSRIQDPKTGHYLWFRTQYSVLFDDDGRPVRAVATGQNIQQLKDMERNFVHAEAQNGILTWELDLHTRSLVKITAEEDATDCPMGNSIRNAPDSMIAAGIYAEESIGAIRRVFEQIYGGAAQASAKVRRWSPKKQSYNWYELIFTALSDNGDQPEKALCTSRDITEEKRLEQLYQEELSHRSDLGSTLITCCQVNLSRSAVEAVYLNNVNCMTPEMTALTDYRRRMECFLDDIHLSEADNALFSPTSLIAAYRAGRYQMDKSFMARKKGKDHLIWVSASCHLVQRPDTGDIIAFFYNSDATAAYIKEHVTAAVLESDYDYAGLVLLENRHLWVRSSHREQCAVPPEWVSNVDDFVNTFTVAHLVGENAADCAACLRLDEVIRQLAQAPIYMVEGDYLEKDGSVRRKRWKFTVSDSVHHILAVSRTDVEGIVREERRKQERLAQLVRAADQASAAKSEFLARMSHEIRTPLNGVIGLATLLESEKDPAVAEDYRQKIVTSSRYLTRLIGDILDMSKIESGEILLNPQVWRFSEFWAGLEATVLPLCEQKCLRFIKDCTLPDLPVRVDHVRFTQIFFNLISNAVKYTPEHGTIRFSCRGGVREGMLAADYTVADNGIGMSEEFQKHMFEPFSQESSEVWAATQGTGLGLGIAKAFTELMGGSIAVESAPGKGTSFRIHLALPLAGQPDAASAVPLAGSLRGAAILVAEDHPINQLITVKLLEKRDARVLTANDGREAVQRFAQSPVGGISAILMDLRMPEMDGLAACRAIRAMDRPDAVRVPIVAMTANAFDRDRSKALAAGMDAYLAKPVDAQVLYQTLAGLLFPGESPGM
jgi:signal transduction histidine kinase